MFSQPLTRETITLRPYETSDINAWQRWDVDPEIQVFMPEPENSAMTDAEQLEYLQECEHETDGYYWSIVWAENNALIGSIALTEINTHHGTAEIGVVVGEKDYWGKGVATQAIALVLNLARTSLKLRRISAEYEEGNIGVAKSLEKSGFIQECVSIQSRIKNGHPINTVRMYILL